MHGVSVVLGEDRGRLLLKLSRHNRTTVQTSERKKCVYRIASEKKTRIQPCATNESSSNQRPESASRPLIGHQTHYSCTALLLAHVGSLSRDFKIFSHKAYCNRTDWYQLPADVYLDQTSFFLELVARRAAGRYASRMQNAVRSWIPLCRRSVPGIRWQALQSRERRKVYSSLSRDNEVETWTVVCGSAGSINVE